MSWESIDDLCEEWDTEREKHPFHVEGLSEEAIQNCWDESAPDYTGVEYADIRGSIIDEMISRGILAPGSELLDLGCGPGLYDFPFAEIAKRVTCVDGSRGMIERIESKCHEDGIDNIETRVALWEDFDTDERYDIVFSSLCPALNDPTSILRMERYSKGYCVYISSANPGPGISLEIWKRLGKDCSFWGYDTHYPYEYLRMLGREPSLKFYHNEIVHERPVEDAIAMQRRYLGRYREMTPELEGIITDVVRSHEVDGIVKETKRLTLGLLIWKIA